MNDQPSHDEYKNTPSGMKTLSITNSERLDVVSSFRAVYGEG